MKATVLLQTPSAHTQTTYTSLASLAWTIQQVEQHHDSTCCLRHYIDLFISLFNLFNGICAIRLHSEGV